MGAIRSLRGGADATSLRMALAETAPGRQQSLARVVGEGAKHPQKERRNGTDAAKT
jgi:hypothetical protein